MVAGGSTSRLNSEPVVLFVRSDPEPRNNFTVPQTYGAIVVANPHDTDAVTPLLKPQRRAIRFSLPGARIALALASGSRAEAHQNISKTANASCRSRQILKPACANIRADVFGDAVQPSAFGKIGVDLAIPRGLIPFANEGSKFGELFGGKCFHGRFYFRETHA